MWQFYVGITNCPFKSFWFHAGTGRNRRFIPVYKAVEKVGKDVCNLLPAMYALTGCDSTSSLNVTAQAKREGLLH